MGYDLKYENEDLLEEHVVQKHVGWTAYPGESDLEKFKAGYENKKESNKE